MKQSESELNEPYEYHVIKSGHHEPLFSEFFITAL